MTFLFHLLEDRAQNLMVRFANEEKHVFILIMTQRTTVFSIFFLIVSLAFYFVIIFVLFQFASFFRSAARSIKKD